MTENIKKLLELASFNEELKNRISRASKDEIISIAKENGISLTDADFEASMGEVSDSELNAVAGGGFCACPLAGGGSSGEKSKTCACVLGGGGETKSGKMRCMCTGGGMGEDPK